MELLFDLVFVAFVGQLAHGIHGDPGVWEFATFIVLYFPAWWAWANIVLVVNLRPNLTARALGLAMITAMAAAALMAAAAPDAFGERAWAFSLANAGLRGLLLVLWLGHRRDQATGSAWRIWVYNGGTALLWTVAVFLPINVAAVVWVVAIAVEVVMVVLSHRIGADRSLRGIDVEHAGERLGLFVIIVLGESVFVTVTEASANWNPQSGVTATLGFLLVALLGWGFFQHGITTLSNALHDLKAKDDLAGLLRTTLFAPFMPVVGIAAVAAAIATAIPAPNVPLPSGAAIALGGGLALYYGTNAAVSLRHGTSRPRVLRWAAPSLTISVAAIPLAGAIAAPTALTLVVGALFAVAGATDLRRG